MLGACSELDGKRRHPNSHCSERRTRRYRVMSLLSLRPDSVAEMIASDLVVVMPVYNEESNIASVVAEWSAAFEKESVRYVFVIVNDGSRDGTLDKLRELEAASPATICVIDKLNSGHGTSCRLGYEIAVRAKAEWVLQIDSDGQCDPAFFAAFWGQRDRADVVFGVRATRDDGIARVITSQICRLGSSLVCGMDLKDANVPYRLMRRTVLAAALPRVSPGFNIHNVALTYALRGLPGIRIAEVPIHFRNRQGGENSINVLKVASWGAAMLFELLQLRISEPKRWVHRPGGGE